MRIKFKKERETKNKIRFNEILDEGNRSPIIGALYIVKEIAKNSTEVEVDVTFIN